MIEKRAQLLLGLLALLLGACSRPVSEARLIGEARVREPVGRDVRWGATTAERFRFRDMTTAPTGGVHYHWSTPAGWRELPPSSLRQANFQVAGDPSTVCYLTVLEGEGGGIAANVNRWRGQMSAPDQSAEEIAALPRGDLFGSPATFVDVEGTWTGMGGTENGEEYRMVGLALVEGGSSKFLKMVGPADVVARELDAFHALAASFVEDSSTHGSPAAGTAPAGVQQEGRGGGLTWEAPDGWKRAEEKPMRAVTFRVGENDESECYVSVLGGTGGGLVANINRWRDQMGRPDFTAEELEALPMLPMLGTEATYVEIDGTYVGMGDQLEEEAKLLGTVCLLSGRSIFVKMIGPFERIEAERENFMAFCKSIESDS